MRILMITPYVTINSRPELSRNKTGFGYMVYDIAKSVGKLELVDVFCSDSLSKRFEMEGVNYLQRSYYCLFKNLPYCLSPIVLWRLWYKYRMSKESLIRLLYYWLLTGYLYSLLKGVAYDIIHFHGCGFETELWLQVCKRCREKSIVTLHGLNSFSKTSSLEECGKNFERDFLKCVADGEIPITVISTGMKKQIENYYKPNDDSYIKVVTNSFSFDQSCDQNHHIRNHYNIPQDSKILLYVGNITENKNQRQMIESFDLLSEDLQNSTYVLFCGKPDESIPLTQMIKSKKNGSHLIMCGGVDKENMPQYYNEADATVLLSFSEGFGLSLIEGMHFGKPCATFTDLDAFEDIYNEKAVVPIKDRSNYSVAEAITRLLSEEWDENTIKDYSKNFESANMACNYIKAYRYVLEH